MKQTADETTDKRLNILGDDEIDALYESGCEKGGRWLFRTFRESCSAVK